MLLVTCVTEEESRQGLKKLYEMTQVTQLPNIIQHSAALGTDLM